MPDPKLPDPIPPALPAPPGDVIVLDTGLFELPLAASRNSPRKRIILPFHKEAADTLHRMFNVLQRGSYIRPHRHSTPPKAESLIVLQGSLGCVAFDKDGKVTGTWALTAGGDRFGIDIAAGLYHTFLALEDDTVVFEVKPGPYDPSADKGFAPWAPAEGDTAAATYLRELTELVRRAPHGERT